MEEYALALIENSLSSTPLMPELKTGADVVAYWQAQGLIGDWADRKDIADSVEYAGKLREKAQTRAR